MLAPLALLPAVAYTASSCACMGIDSSSSTPRHQFLDAHALFFFLLLLSSSSGREAATFLAAWPVGRRAFVRNKQNLHGDKLCHCSFRCLTLHMHFSLPQKMLGRGTVWAQAFSQVGGGWPHHRQRPNGFPFSAIKKAHEAQACTEEDDPTKAKKILRGREVCRIYLVPSIRETGGGLARRALAKW